MRLRELYLKIANTRNCSIEEVVEFIELVISKLFPDKKYDPQQIISAIQMGMPIVQQVIEMVESNPDKVGFQVAKLWSKPNMPGENRTLLKVMCYDIRE